MLEKKKKKIWKKRRKRSLHIKIGRVVLSIEEEGTRNTVIKVVSIIIVIVSIVGKESIDVRDLNLVKNQIHLGEK